MNNDSEERFKAFFIGILPTLHCTFAYAYDHMSAGLRHNGDGYHALVETAVVPALVNPDIHVKGAAHIAFGDDLQSLAAAVGRNRP